MFNKRFLTKYLTKTRLLLRNNAVGFISICLASQILLLAGCLSPRDGGTGSVTNDGFRLKEHEIRNARFELGNPQIIKPARILWLNTLNQGNAVYPKWDTFEFHWEREGEICGFAASGSNSNCEVCDVCAPPRPDTPVCQVAPSFTGGYLQIGLDEGFVKTENPKSVFQYVGTYAVNKIPETCSNSNNPFSFQPQQDGLYRIMFDPNIVSVITGAADGEIGIHIVKPGLSETEMPTYKLTYMSVDATNYWTWATDGDDLWTENFSPDLRVVKVQFFRGNCADGSMRGEKCKIPSEPTPVKPSRILFLPAFLNTVMGHPGEASHRCYTNSSVNTDNSISIFNCHGTFAPNPTQQKVVTPTYEVFPSNPDQKLTWLAEFNTNEGGDADLLTPGNQPMPSDADLIIQFIIEAQ